MSRRKKHDRCKRRGFRIVLWAAIIIITRNSNAKNLVVAVGLEEKKIFLHYVTDNIFKNIHARANKNENYLKQGGRP